MHNRRVTDWKFIFIDFVYTGHRGTLHPFSGVINAIDTIYKHIVVDGQTDI